MHVIVAGSRGLIGTRLVDALVTRGDRVTRLVRPTRATASTGDAHPAARAVVDRSWDPARRRLSPAVLDGADAVVVLNGTSIGHLPWTRSRRRALAVSRRDSVRTVVRALRELGTAAPALLSASAVGYYGSAPGKVLTEQSPPGHGFLPGLCAAWEREALRADDVSRVTLVRSASVIHPDALLRPLLALTRLGVAGPLGDGRQVWPWISLTDEVRAILHLLDTGLAGPVNLAGPVPATAEEIGRALARRLHRPYLLPAPAPLLRAALGADAADGLLLADADVRPARLKASGFRFRHRSVHDALDEALPGAPDPEEESGNRCDDLVRSV